MTLSIVVLAALALGADDCGNSKKDNAQATPQAPCASLGSEAEAQCARVLNQWRTTIAQSQQALTRYQPQAGQWPTIAQQIAQSRQTAQQGFQAQQAQAQQLDQQRAAALQAWWYQQRTAALNRQIELIRQQRAADQQAAQEAEAHYQQTQQEEYNRRKIEYENAVARASDADRQSVDELERTRAAYDEVRGP